MARARCRRSRVRDHALAKPPSRHPLVSRFVKVRLSTPQPHGGVERRCLDLWHKISQRLTPEEIARLVLSYEAGSSTTQLEDAFGLSHGSVVRLLQKHGVETRFPGLSDEEAATAQKLYESGSPLAEVSKQVGQHEAPRPWRPRAHARRTRRTARRVLNRGAGSRAVRPRVDGRIRARSTAGATPATLSRTSTDPRRRRNTLLPPSSPRQAGW
jgi:hypothetical protein